VAGLETEVFVSARKYFSLANVVSEASNEDGIAEFTNLTITGAFDHHAYIVFEVDGVTAVWTTIYNPRHATFELPPRNIRPYFVNQQIGRIYILTDFPSEVIEG
jgi:hypothetical protein